MDDLNATPLGQLVQPLSELPHNAVFPLVHRGGINGDMFGSDPHRLRGADLFQQMRRCQQRFRGDAAMVQALTAKRRSRVDQGHLQAEIGGAKGGGVTTWAAADDDHLRLALDLTHDHRFHPQRTGGAPPI